MRPSCTAPPPRFFASFGGVYHGFGEAANHGQSLELCVEECTACGGARGEGAYCVGGGAAYVQRLRSSCLRHVTGTLSPKQANTGKMGGNGVRLGNFWILKCPKEHGMFWQ